RFAVAAGRYADVEALLDRYKLEVEAAWRVASAEQRQSLAVEVMKMLRWAQRTMLASRSHARLKQAESSRRMAYARPTPARSTVSIDG
ncbi:MAG TPA: hypothetical protein VKS01_04765, partial [Bryobacteraceae bacterium]|nr:hypothetical protein [Bryobacteraceae bacterium]